jgi:DNA-binding FrmR family transcriptional regulator
VAREKVKLQNRIKRLRGQVEALERAIEHPLECAVVLQQATSFRGALDGFIAEVMEDHIREHMRDPSGDEAWAAAADELIDIVHRYLKR